MKSTNTMRALEEIKTLNNTQAVVMIGNMIAVSSMKPMARFDISLREARFVATFTSGPTVQTDEGPIYSFFVQIRE